MMLRHLGETGAADRLKASVMRHLEKGRVLTPDMGGSARTTEVRDALIREIESAPERRSERRRGDGVAAE
jgi:isocitrate/isopropylmalate dehydrogenase